MKNTQEITLFVLIGLTLLTAAAANFIGEKAAYLPLLIMGIAAIKFLLVAFQFMELKEAHRFWKILTAVVGVSLAFLIGVLA
ncbi:cytochrome C oxidase subunit IV family protein [Cyclobacterium amurskyense]|uniref:Cytochrome C oxidase subunit IV n=1 Tax=Cyclobacterium amurskyense TaxID=320787 RepID=A0A0H4P5H7_9BACT|nr:cytochrome C oxidase subunit IV family protein [Cyclobacterium amurskyense]AKP49666.1 hypothetical protein CA2015_0184 [Cyclobacterium amurskyense]|tara:strand:+ start:1083 stop:1328 length:246 start_codon:yes stop_codon:yes gene_type:complete